MFTGMGKGARKKTLPCKDDGNAEMRSRRVIPLSTAAGREIAKAAGNWWILGRVGSDLLALRNEIPPAHGELYPSGFLPGYLPAWNSAFLAWAQLFGRLPSTRELYKAAQNRRNEPGSWDFKNTLALVLAECGDGSHGELITPAMMRRHQDGGTRRAFVHELQKRMANGVRKDLPNPLAGNDGKSIERSAPFGDIFIIRQTMVQMWVAGGFWLRSDKDIAAFLRGLEMSPARGETPVVVTEGNVKRIRDDLKLRSYVGRGRLVYCAPGKMEPNQTLQHELWSAMRFLHKQGFFEGYKDCLHSLIAGKALGMATGQDVWEKFFSVANYLQTGVINDCPRRPIPNSAWINGLCRR